MGQIVRKSNALTSAAHRLTAAEQRIVLCAISQVTAMRVVSDEVLYKVSTHDLVAAGLNQKHASEVLHNACEQLFSRAVTVIAEDGKPITTRWLQSLRDPSKTDGSWAELRFSKDLIPYLSNLSEQFTQYNLRDAVSLSSAYAVRIFELMMQYRTIGSRVISLEELRSILMLENKYQVFSDFRKRVLDTSIEQINEKTGIKAKYELMRTGRKITHIKLIFVWSKCGKIEGDSKNKKEFESMTLKQRKYFASLLAEISAIQGIAPAGMSAKEFIEWLANELSKPERIVEWESHLKEKGYIPTIKKFQEATDSEKTSKKEKPKNDEPAPAPQTAPKKASDLLTDLANNESEMKSNNSDAKKAPAEWQDLVKKNRTRMKGQK